jgi:hypothetical protein
LLVLITRIGHQISEETYAEVSSVIEQVHRLDIDNWKELLNLFLHNAAFPQVREVQIHDKHGGSRIIGVRYCASYPLENNDWGEFQVVLIYS